MAPPAQNKKDPIKSDPLPNPGESLEGQMLEVAFEKIMRWGICALVLIILVFEEWFSYLLELPRQPMLITVLAVPIVVYCGWRISKHLHLLRDLRLGLRGEKAVGQFLERLRVLDYWVIHDLVESDTDGSEFNIDHMLIGPGGIFVIETKTRSKPARGNAIIRYDGDRVSVDGGPFDDAPIRQALAAARCVRQILEECTGRTDIPVRRDTT